MNVVARSAARPSSGDGTPRVAAYHKRLAAQAKEHGRSMEAEVRDILTRASSRPHIGVALMQVARDVGGFDDLPIPDRSDTARAVDFG